MPDGTGADLRWLSRGEAGFGHHGLWEWRVLCVQEWRKGLWEGCVEYMYGPGRKIEMTLLLCYHVLELLVSSELQRTSVVLSWRACVCLSLLHDFRIGVVGPSVSPQVTCTPDSLCIVIHSMRIDALLSL